MSSPLLATLAATWSRRHDTARNKNRTNSLFLTKVYMFLIQIVDKTDLAHAGLNLTKFRGNDVIKGLGSLASQTLYLTATLVRVWSNARIILVLLEFMI